MTVSYFWWSGNIGEKQGDGGGGGSYNIKAKSRFYRIKIKIKSSNSSKLTWLTYDVFFWEECSHVLVDLCTSPFHYKH